MSHSIDDSSLIFRTANGKVLRCACCDRLEVVFGNLAVAQEPPLFRRFRRVVKQLDTDAEAYRADEERPVLLSVDGDRLAFRFTRAEARELEELLDGAAAMLELGDLVDDALGSDPPEGTRS
jgi:F0F1-type ATP synthase beta subunit